MPKPLDVRCLAFALYIPRSHSAFPRPGYLPRATRSRAGRVWRACAAQAEAEAFMIRPAVREDALQIANVVWEAFQDEGELHPWGLLRRYVQRGDLASQFAARTGAAPAKQHALLLATAPTNEILGCVEIGAVQVPTVLARGNPADAWEQEDFAGRRRKTTDNDGLERTPYIGNLAVARGSRRRGVASRLVEAAEQEARDWGAGQVVLHVDERNKAAKALYRSRGYVCTLREPDWYTFIGRIQRLFLAKELYPDVLRTNEDWENAPVRHTRRLNAAEYVKWCFYDLRMRDK